jgi:hypothetical protein
MNAKEIKKIWEEKGKGLIVPKVVLAYDKNGEKYFVYEDHTNRLYLNLDKTNISFVLLKKYTKKEKDWYLILNRSKMSSISCHKKNEYQTFVQEYLIGQK